MTAGSVPSRHVRAAGGIVLGGLTAGVLDLLDAFAVTMINGGEPVRVVQAIASGVIGREAYNGGGAVAALGLLLHFIIALSAAATYFVMNTRLPILTRRPIWSGIVFGLGVWAFMYYVVLPFTFGRPNTLPAWPMLLNQLGIHAFGVGLPIAWFVARTVAKT